MSGILNTEQIRYVLFHAGHHFSHGERIMDSMLFLNENDGIENNRIIFRLSNKVYDPGSVIWIDDVPVLFPLNNSRQYYTIANGSVVFSHDLLKSAFFLLSGWQEKDNSAADNLGRFPFEQSVQAQLNIVSKPVVNYYFEVILKGIGEYCSMHGIEFTRKKAFQDFAFFLTHDIDRISYYNFNTFLYTLMQLTGRKPSVEKPSWLLKKLMRTGVRMMTSGYRNDPYWNFGTMAGIERKKGIRSTWFFLPRDQKHTDAYYSLRDPAIRNLIRWLAEEGHEIGLHGTVRSHNSADALKEIVSGLTEAAGMEISGIRQHRLKWRHPQTAVNQESAGLAYDSTLGFAAHEGFRNSYCHPFRLYDFAANRMLSSWEIPLNVMDTTLFDYRQLDEDGAYKAAGVLMDEVQKFSGVFTLLWHNSYLNDFEKPGISHFYETLLDGVMMRKPEVLTGNGIINRMKTLNNG